MNIPATLRYTKDHEWLSIDGDIAIGVITDFAQRELEDIVFVDIETEGETLGSGEVFGTVEAVKTVSDLFMPVSGEVIEVNSGIVTNPESVNKDPYGQGWMIKVRITDQSEIEALLSSADYQNLVG